ncbi:hypothetical protein JCM4814A_21630 [Streptomyces phaeofaciens JCM 4814]|uniref:Uncharacterized protein n=1 Tax=Streptomyces phaeofaciens TaxID=68254 RepID=A0A918HQ68_9ACTN|nr:hypothetical protein GCM10010226_85520 [Streptomyces phaeofaciens]
MHALVLGLYEDYWHRYTYGAGPVPVARIEWSLHPKDPAEAVALMARFAAADLLFPEYALMDRADAERIAGRVVGLLGRDRKVASSARRAGLAASGACDRKAEGRPRTGCTRVIPTTRRACVPGVASQTGLCGHGLGPGARWWSNTDDVSSEGLVGCTLDGLVVGTDGERFAALIQVADD